MGYVFAILTLRTSSAPDWSDAVFFWAVATLANFIGRIEVQLGGLAGLALVRGDRPPRGIPLAPGFIVLITAAYATRLSTALLVAAFAALTDYRRGLLRLFFNSAQEILYVGGAAFVYMGLRTLLSGVPGAFVAAAIAAFVAIALNHLFVGFAVSLDQGVPITEVVTRMAWPAPLSLGFGLIALLIATLFTEFGAISAVFLFMPLTALRVVREAKMNLDAATDQTIANFARAVDEKDPYTYHHSDRVATITAELHRELGTSRKDLDRRWYGAMLHDVGKVAVPAAILAKPGALTTSEFDAIKRHPRVGADAVQEIDLFRDLAPEIRHHHERLDGAGYPDGLSGDDIPLAARVLAVADAFDALTSDRPYRAAFSYADALAELSRSAGAQHDPRVVEALRVVIERGISFVRADRSGPEGSALGVTRSA
jgi:putative nucleotidyltransferase with HDIG domain